MPLRNAGDDDTNALIRKVHSEFAGFTERQDRRVADINETIGNLTASVDAIQRQVDGGITQDRAMPLPVDAEYTRAFASYARRGDAVDVLKGANATGERATVQAAMSSGSATDGGYLAPVEWDRKLHQRQRLTSPMRRLATVQVTSVGEYTTVWNGDEWGTGWVGETAARPQTTTPTLAQVPFASGEIYANAAITQRLLDDSAVNIDQWLAESLEREFNRQENIAFLSGNGVSKPHGLLTYAPGAVNETRHPGGPLTVVEGDIDYDGLVDFLYSLDAPYRQNSSWLMSSLTAAVIAKLKDADGRPLWREALIADQPPTLLGRPVEIDEGMPTPVAGNTAIAFGDFKAGYLINDRIGTRILRDPYTNKPFIMFYATKRVGAGVLDPFAIRLMRVAA
ncbi:phage major capsid protein [Stakelama sp. CBK3Z-3]|uniref:Phage major capsid protein n=1 Tax=Stakelama flava TaxID=2860338 RepID=A0ABS6XIK2_9SPHN|nr:phage major capsid protein [Stakelama flava]MBW4330038.1 phage major capsid protein [Stakelama flava]